MGAKTARIVAAALAVLLAAAYFLLPAVSLESYMSNSGRKKQLLAEGEEYSWQWTPELEGCSRADLRLSGMKRARGVTVHAELTDSSGNRAASASVAVADLGEDGDTVRLEGKFEQGTAYTLRVRAEGEGELKLKGEVDPETEAFIPLVNETGSHETRNAALLYFAAGLLLMAGTPVFGGKDRKPELRRPDESRLSRALPWATFFLLASLGMFITLIKPMFMTGADWNSWDEEVHWGHVLTMGSRNPGGLRGMVNGLITFHPGYLPLILGYNIGSIFTRWEGELYHFAVGTGALCYAGLCALAVKHAPRYKASFLAAATMPTFLFLATSASYDPVAAGCILLGLAMLLEILEREERIAPLQGITLLSVLAFGTVAKPLYSPILLTLELIPNRRFASRRMAWIFRFFVILVLIWCVLAALVPGPYDNVWEGDARFEDVSTPDQFRYMMAHPIEGGLKPLISVLENPRVMFVEGIAHWGFVGNNGTLNQLWLFLMLILAPLCTVGEPRDGESLLKPWLRVFLMAIAIGTDALFAYALYLTSSPVGGELGGMQGRYFMPVWIAAELALMWPRGIRRRMGRVGEGLIIPIWFFCFGANLWNAVNHMIATGLL